MSSEAVAFEPEPATESCPWCGNVISREEFEKIEARIADQERKRLAAERVRMQQELEAHKQSTEIALRAEAEKKIAAFNAEREQREAGIRKEAAATVEARVRGDMDKKLGALITERDQGAAKIKELEAVSVKQKNDLEQQRTALERDRTDQLLKLQAQHQREKGQLQQKVDTLSRQLQRKTADELGEGAELDAYEALREAFTGDDITRVKRGEPGADIRHKVLHKGTACGTIVIDSKNRQAWQNSYVTKLREDQIAAKAEHAVLATTVFPSGKKELYLDEETGVIVVSRARVCEIVELLRNAMVRVRVLKLSLSERNEKRDLLYKYIASDEYRQHQQETARLAGELSELDVEEKREHDKVWLKRGKMVTRLRNVVRQVETEVSAILENRPAATGGGA
ncbi:MAG: DUF2130 domain-containing protein [Candidatus Eisenbacteria bacterium]|nr:DUF2130 domain-containing protein [Candidatus Eisenbacteria bacterium]